MQTNVVNIHYYGPENTTGPYGVNNRPTASMSVNLDSSRDLLEQLAEVQQAAYKIQASTSLLFKLIVPAQTRTSSGLVASLFPTTSKAISSCRNAALAAVGAFFALLLDLPTLPIRLITLIPRAIQQSINDNMAGTIVKREFAGYTINYKDEYSGDNINWNRGRIAIDDFRIEEGERLENTKKVYFLGY